MATPRPIREKIKDRILLNIKMLEKYETAWGGWNYYDWGYRGSGFLWYGIKQPILDRAFDVWDKSSEKYYEEIKSKRKKLSSWNKKRNNY